MRPHGLGNQILHNFLNNGLERTLIALKISGHALLGILCHHVNLYVDAIAFLLLGQDDFFLGVRDEHNLPPALGIVDGGNGQTGAVKGNEALVHNVAQNLAVLGLKAQSYGVAVGGAADNGGDAVDVALDKVAAHAGVGADGALEVDARAGAEVAEVGQAQGLGGDADGEAGARVGLGGEGRGRQAHAVDGDAVAQDGVGQELGRGGQRNGEGGAAGRILLVELGDLCLGVMRTLRSAVFFPPISGRR